MYSACKIFETFHKILFFCSRLSSIWCFVRRLYVMRKSCANKRRQKTCTNCNFWFELAVTPETKRIKTLNEWKKWDANIFGWKFAEIFTNQEIKMRRHKIMTSTNHLNKLFWKVHKLKTQCDQWLNSFNRTLALYLFEESVVVCDRIRNCLKINTSTLLFFRSPFCRCIFQISNGTSAMHSTSNLSHSMRI